MPLSTKFKSAREAAGLSQGETAKSLKVTQGYVSHVETNRRLSIPPDFAKKAAKLFGVAASYFDEFVSEQGVKATSEVANYPEFGTVEAGKGVDEAGDGQSFVNIPQKCDGADGVYRVKGLSMEGAGILPGDYLVVRKTDTPGDGDLVVAWTRDYGAVVKRVEVLRAEYRQGIGYRLLTEGEDKDKRYPYIMRPENGDRFYAVVIAVFREYRPAAKSPARPTLKPVKPPAKRKPS